MTADADTPRSLAILGCGNMGEAILRGLLAREGSPTIHAYDPNDSRRAALADLALRWSPEPAAAVREADVVLLAVKPQTMAVLLEQIAPVAEGRLLVSIAAGVTTGFIESRVPGARVVRTMPNTPLLAGRGVVGLSAGASAAPGDLATAQSLFPQAILLDVAESQMNAITAVSGSGPAYFFAFVEALAAAAQAEGFDEATAATLAAGTFTGAAALLEHSGLDAAELRRRVTSPGGTTQAALEVLTPELNVLVRSAVAAAVRRGRELGGA